METSDFEVRVDRAADARRFLDTDEIVWFSDPTTESAEDALLGLPPEGRFAASVDAQPESAYAGVYGVRPMVLGVPAGDGVAAVPMAGLTWVGVHPDLRRRGVLTAMLRHHVEQTHSDGVAISGLHASEPGIYGRYGYGPAIPAVMLTLSRGATFTAPGLEERAGRTTTVLATISDRAITERIHALAHAHARSEVGIVAGTENFYRNIVKSAQRAQVRRDQEPMRFLFARRDGEDVGVAALRRHHKWEDGRPQGQVEVFYLGGDTAARLVLLRRLVDLDLMASVKLPAVGLDDPLLHWVGPRAAGGRAVVDNLWLRVVDLPAALRLRSYAEDCDVVLDVEDPLAPWQSGRWRIVVRDGAAEARRTNDAADLSSPISVLGSLLLGGVSAASLHRAGHLTEHRPAAAVELDRAFRTRVGPSAAEGF